MSDILDVFKRHRRDEWAVNGPERDSAIERMEADKARIEELESSLSVSTEDTERLDWIERNYAAVEFNGVEAEYVEGGSIAKDRWKVESPYGNATEYGIRLAIDRARGGSTK